MSDSERISENLDILFSYSLISRNGDLFDELICKKNESGEHNVVSVGDEAEGIGDS